MQKVDTKALEGILDYLMKSKPKKKDVIEAKVEEPKDEVTTDDIEDDFEDLVKTASPRNKTQKSVMMSISRLGLRKPKVEEKIEEPAKRRPAKKRRRKRK